MEYKLKDATIVGIRATVEEYPYEGDVVCITFDFDKDVRTEKDPWGTWDYDYVSFYGLEIEDVMEYFICNINNTLHLTTVENFLDDMSRKAIL